MGTNSARPSDLEDFASGSREADDRLRELHARLQGAITDFVSGTSWGTFDAGTMMLGLRTYADANTEDGRWVTRIAQTFRHAGADGTLLLPDAALEASLRAVGLDGGRRAITFTTATAYGAPPTSGYANDPVNTGIGNFVEIEADLPFGGLSAELTLRRTYNSRATESVGGFGPGWSSWDSARLVATPDGADYQGPDGQQAHFPRAGEGFSRAVGVSALVERGASGLDLVWFDGRRWSFDATGRPRSITRGPGTEVRLVHDDTGRLVALEHEAGRAVRLHWTDERITALETSDGRTAGFTYDGARLVGAQGIAGLRRYEVDPAGLIGSVTDADGVVELVNTYDELGRVTSQTSPFGRRTLFAYLPGNVTVTTDEDGTANTFVHDHAARLVAAVDGHENTLRKHYDDWGNPVTIVDRNGAVTVQTWDERDRLTSRTLPTGATFHFGYDEADRVTCVETADAVTELRYEGAERTPSVIIDPEGGITRVSVADGRILEVRDPDDVVVTFQLDADGLPVGITSADGATRVVERDTAGRAIAAVTPSGERTEFTHDQRGLVVARTDPDGAVWRFEYTAAGRLRATVDPEGSRQEYRYGAHGAVAEAVNPLGAVSTRGYDPFGNVVSVADEDGTKWEYGYDALSRLVRLTAPDGATWLRDHDAEGGLLAATDPTGVVHTARRDAVGRIVGLGDGTVSSTYELDDLGRVLAYVRPDGTAGTATYDRCGRRLTETAPDGGVTRFEYTPGGRVRRVVSPTGRTESLEYDACGRLAAVVDPAGGRTTLGYDATGRPVSKTDPTGVAVTIAYDPCGRVVRREDPARGPVTWTYDTVGRIRTVEDRETGRRTFRYDAVGRPIRATDALGGATLFERDGRGHVVRLVDPLGGVTSRTHDEVGRVLTETDPLGHTATFAYDAAGRLVRRQDPTGSSLTWSRDASGRVTGLSGTGPGQRLDLVRDPLGRVVRAGAEELEWDGCGRLVSRGRGDARLTWSYDLDGLRTAMTYPDGSRTRYRRDRAGRTVELEHPLLGVVEVERDGAGRMLSRTGADVRETWAYESGVLTEHTVRRSDAERRSTYRRDERGALVGVARDGADRRFTRDAAGRLTAVSGPDGERTFTYDAGGRLVAETGPESREYTYDAAGRLETAGPLRFEHDAAGRRTVEAGPSGTQRFEWDWRGTLAGVSDGSGRTACQVDGLGELATVGDTAVRWDTADPLAPLAWFDGPVVVDRVPLAAPGWTPDGIAPADPWGAASGQPGMDHRGDLTAAGLVWLRNRAYEPATRGFLSADPLPPVWGTAWSANPYHFAGDDPIGRLDPLGLRPLTDADMEAFRQQLSGGVTGFVADNWDYIAAGAMVIAGVALMATGAGGAAGVALWAGAGALVGGGLSITQQKLLTGEVDWGEVGVNMVVGAIAGGAGGYTTLVGGSALRQYGVHAVSEAGQDAVQQYAETGRIDVAEVVLSGVMGGAVEALSPTVGDVAETAVRQYMPTDVIRLAVVDGTLGIVGGAAKRLAAGDPSFDPQAVLFDATVGGMSGVHEARFGPPPAGKPLLPPPTIPGPDIVPPSMLGTPAWALAP